MKIFIIIGLLCLISFGIGFIAGWVGHTYKQLKDLADLWWYR